MSLEDETAVMARLVERGEARAGHLESHHGKASIVIDKHDLDAMRDIKAWLEGIAAPGGTTERETDWFAFFCRKYVQRSDARQKESGLQYTEAETHDLAKECARHETASLTATEDGARRAALTAIKNITCWESLSFETKEQIYRALATEATPGEGGT